MDIFYPPLINLFETTSQKNTVSTKITGDQVRSPEDLPRRLIAGLLDPESFHYSEADGKKQWKATWKSWDDELQLEVSWTAGERYEAWIYAKGHALLGGVGAGNAPLAYALMQLRGLYAQMLKSHYLNIFSPARQEAFFLPDGLRLMFLMPIHAENIKEFWEILESHREELITGVTVRLGLLEAQVSTPADDYLEEFSPENLYESTGVKAHLGQQLINGRCRVTTKMYTVGMHFGLADLPLLHHIWWLFPPLRPYLYGNGMDISTASEVLLVKRTDVFWDIYADDWLTSYRVDPTLQTLFNPNKTDIPTPGAETGLKWLDGAIQTAKVLRF